MMSFDDYRREVLADAKEAIGEGARWWGSWEEVCDALWVDDAVTGNGSGSYTFSTARALDNVRGLLGDPEFAGELEAAGLGPEVWAMGPEVIDVVARCLALGCVAGELEASFREGRMG